MVSRKNCYLTRDFDFAAMQRGFRVNWPNVIRARVQSKEGIVWVVGSGYRCSASARAPIEEVWPLANISTKRSQLTTSQFYGRKMQKSTLSSQCPWLVRSASSSREPWRLLLSYFGL